VTEERAERFVSLSSEPWDEAMAHPCDAVGKAEVAATEPSSPPIEVTVSPDDDGPRASADRRESAVGGVSKPPSPARPP